MKTRNVKGETGQLAQSNSPLKKGYNRAAYFFKNNICDKFVKKRIQLP